jgi:hypothetical protein
VSEEPGVEALEELRRLYEETRVYNYAPQDPSIRWLKTNFLRQDDYEYRVNVFQFSNPAR